MSKMSRMCIVHYYGMDSYTKIKNISILNERRIREAKILRENFKDENYHQDQCDMIPGIIDQTYHGIHKEPCYKIFTSIFNESRNSLTSLNTTDTSDNKCVSGDSVSPLDIYLSNGKWLYPKVCVLCQKYRIKMNGRHVFPVGMHTFNSTNDVKGVDTFTSASSYTEICKFHRKCYDIFTCEYDKTSNAMASTTNVISPISRSSVPTSPSMVRVTLRKDP